MLLTVNAWAGQRCQKGVLENFSFRAAFKAVGAASWRANTDRQKLQLTWLYVHSNTSNCLKYFFPDHPTVITRPHRCFLQGADLSVPAALEATESTQAKRIAAEGAKASQRYLLSDHFCICLAAQINSAFITVFAVDLYKIDSGFSSPLFLIDPDHFLHRPSRYAVYELFLPPSILAADLENSLQKLCSGIWSSVHSLTAWQGYSSKGSVHYWSLSLELLKAYLFLPLHIKSRVFLTAFTE